MKKSGFTLIEVMIAMGLMSIVALGTAQLFTQVFAGQNGINQTFDAFQFIETVDGVTRVESTCQPTLAGQPFNTTAGVAVPVVYHDPTGPITTGSQIGKLTVKRVTITSVAPVGTNFLADLAFTFQLSGKVMGPSVIVRKLRLQITTASGLITDCF